MVLRYNEYRPYLRAVLDGGGKGKKIYTIRAFSDRMSVSNSFLSEVLSGKKSLSMELAFKIAVKLDLTEAETQYFCLMVQLEQEKDAVFRAEIAKRLEAFRPNRKSHSISADVFKNIADWYHSAILELTYLSGFKMTSESVADRLKIAKKDAEAAISRLERLALLEKDLDGNYKKTHRSVHTESAISNQALRQCHEQILQKAIESLHKQTPKERMSATDFVPIDSKYLPEVDRLSQEFSNSVMKLAEKSKIKDSVYALAVHFFKLT